MCIRDRHGTVAEIGVRGNTTGAADAIRWQWDTSLYYARIHDEILSIDNPTAPGTSLSTNVDSTCLLYTSRCV